MPLDPDAYADYEGFLKAAIKRYWASEKCSKVDLLASLLATREAWEAAWDEATAPGRSSTLLKGAAGAAAITVLLRTVIGGPLGLLLTGVSVASLAALYAKHHERIWAQVDRYRALVDEYRPQYDEVIAGRADDKLTQSQHELMIDGLMARFVERLEEIPNIEGTGESSEASETSD